jgi:hypothetical protein
MLSSISQRLSRLDLISFNNQTHTVSGYDLTEHVMKEKRYAGMEPMERFLCEEGSSLERQSNRKVPKGLL